MITAMNQGDRSELRRIVVAHMQPALNSYKDAHGGWSGLGSADDRKEAK
jgi:hypothetical protein